jgi:hypothetical protein
MSSSSAAGSADLPRAERLVPLSGPAAGLTFAPSPVPALRVLAAIVFLPSVVITVYNNGYDTYVNRKKPKK